MKIAFYAPMKPPDDPVPSGDRRMGQLLVRALTLAGHEVELASRLRARDGVGDRAAQERIRLRARRSAVRLVAHYKANRPDLWFTYHLYHKAPDWLGPHVARVLRIPYVICEASFAPKQDGGAWDIGHAQAELALRRADAVINLNSNDAACVAPLLKPGARMVALRPFLDPAPYRGARAANPAPVLLTVAMMRDGDKLASYRLLAAALAKLDDLDWSLVVVGDGAARGEIETLFGRRARFLGEVAEARLPAIYAGADLYVWPAVREAYGMAILEAQAAAVPVVAGDCGGVPDIVRDGATGLLARDGDAEDFAAKLRALLTDPARRAAMGARARETVEAEHSLAAAAAALEGVLADVRRAPAAARRAG
jgi:glycosyltransferase involved in cell wall biosynthesis